MNTTTQQNHTTSILRPYAKRRRKRKRTTKHKNRAITAQGQNTPTNERALDFFLFFLFFFVLRPRLVGSCQFIISRELDITTDVITIDDRHDGKKKRTEQDEDEDKDDIDTHFAFAR